MEDDWLERAARTALCLEQDMSLGARKAGAAAPSFASGVNGAGAPPLTSSRSRCRGQAAVMVETRGWVADSDTLKGAAACEALWDQGEVGEWTQGKSSSILDAGWPAAMASRVTGAGRVVRLSRDGPARRR